MPGANDFSARLGEWKRALRKHLEYRVVFPARYVRDRVLARAGARGGARVRKVALVSDTLAYCSEQQFHPFSAYREEMRDAGILTREFRLDDVMRDPGGALRGFDYVGLKLSYRTPAAEAVDAARTIRQAIPADARLIYMDGDDDVCVQWPAILAFVDLYIKKHVFSDRGDYLKRYAGKSNLHDFVHRTHGYEFKASDYGGPDQEPLIIAESGPVPSEHLHKIAPGWNIALDKPILTLYERMRREPLSHDRPVDVTYRGHVKAETFTYYLRNTVAGIIEGAKDRYVTSGGTARVTPDEYYKELQQSKICISPFGFGEVCWRDFEAVLCGSLLIKPNMDHVETYPNIFVPYETYVPVKWDYSDLQGKIDHYLANEEDRRRIVENAYAVMRNYFDEAAIVKKFIELLDLCERPARSVAPAMDRSDIGRRPRVA